MTNPVKALELLDKKPELAKEEVIQGKLVKLTHLYDLKYCEAKNSHCLDGSAFCQVTTNNVIQIVTHADNQGFLCSEGAYRINECFIRNIDFAVVCCYPNKVKARYPSISNRIIGDSYESVFSCHAKSSDSASAYDVMYLYESK